MEKKYEFIDETKTLSDGTILHRIRALRDFGDVHKGDLGGYIEKEENLSYNGNCWVSGNVRVYDYASVSGNARVCGNAFICGDCTIYGDARISKDAFISSRHDYFAIENIGSRYDTTTFYNCGNNIIRVNCGCFNGTLEEFADKVKEVHGENRFAKEYMAAITFARTKISLNQS